MTTQEFSAEFDILLNSFYSKPSYKEGNSSQELELNEYEKSVLLTQAQEEIVRELYNGRLTGESFEKTEELKRYLDSLIRTIELEPIDTDYTGLTSSSEFYRYPEDTLFITYEQAIISRPGIIGDGIVKVVPMRQDEWHRSKDNPFRKPNKNKVIRLDYSANILELISDYPIIEYIIRYISRPTPIILENLPEDLSIEGEREISDCTLNSALHRIILDKAVQLAYKKFSKQVK